jgi:hypothetical protein
MTLRGFRKFALRGTAMTGMAGVVLAAGAALPAQAQPPLLPVIACVATGNVSFSFDSTTGVNTYGFTGNGSCAGDTQGTYQVSISGTGTSSGAGLCGGSLPLLITKLHLTVQVTLTNVFTGVSRTEQQVWSSPISTFPITTPFLVKTARGGIGAGDFLNRIHGQCVVPPGSPVAIYAWAFTGR